MGEAAVNKVELEKEEKRTRSLLKTAEGRKALENILGLKLNTVSKHPDQQAIPMVCTLVPSHSGPKPQMTYAFQSMVNEARSYCNVIQRPAISSSVVHWVRNMLLKDLYLSGMPFTHVLFIDDDIAPPPDALVKLLSHRKDIVAGACTVRQDPPLPNFRTYNPETYKYSTVFEWKGKDGAPDEGLLEVGAVGTGLMLITRKALEDVAEYYFSYQHERDFFGMSEELAKKLSDDRRKHAVETGNAWWFEFLKHPSGFDEFGEDIAFCFKAMRKGYKIFVDTSVRCLHFGDYGYGLDDYMAYQSQVIAAKEERNKIVVVE